MPKGTSWNKSISNSEKIKPVALAVIKLHLPEGISQLVNRKFHFRNNVFRVILKALLGLVIPNQYCQGTSLKLIFW